MFLKYFFISKEESKLALDTYLIKHELLQATQSFDLYFSECRKAMNEECLKLNEYSKHGACQCKVGYKLNTYTYACEI